MTAYIYIIVLKTREEGEILIVVNHQKKLFLLNEVAKDFLLLCNSRRLKEIIDELGEIYDVEKNLLTDDLIDTIQDLQYKRILRMEAA